MKNYWKIRYHGYDDNRNNTLYNAWNMIDVKIKITKNVKKFSESSFKNLVLPLCCGTVYTPQKRENGLRNFTWRRIFRFFQSPQKL